ncbi:MAG: AsmA family protein [Candidatus Margulisbacteria bacterium]|nr:AsmA family protein [Candidatus Margulisiibacteriota bacterium]
MKNLLKWTGIIVGVLLVVIIGAAVALPIFLPLEKIKDIAVAKISEAINRDVTVEKVSFNIFSGIKLEKLSISNRPGFAKRPFVSADSIELHYAFWPIFKRQVIITEFRLVKPEVLIEKSAAGEFNFSDMTGGKPKAKAPSTSLGTSKAKDREAGFSVIMNTFSIRDGKITYADYGTGTSVELKEADLTVSGITLAMVKPIGLKFGATVNYKGKDIPLSLAGKIGVNLKSEVLKLPSLSLGVAGEKANISAAVSRWKTGPQIDFAISSKKLSVDPLLAVFTAGASAPKKEKLPRGELTKTVDKSLASLPYKLGVNGSLDIGNVSVLGFEADRVNLGVKLVNKKLTADIKEIKIYDGKLSGKATVNLAASGLSYNVKDLSLTNFNASPFSNAVVSTFLTKLEDHEDLIDKVYGTLDMSASLSGRGVEVPDIMANLVASGSLSLKNGELKSLKMIAAIADKIKTPGLKQDLNISELSANFSMRNQVVTIKNLKLLDHDLGVNFDGALDLSKLKYVDGNRLSLRASPSATEGLSREYNLFRDDKGWLELTFELKGNLKRPIPMPILEKPVEKAVEKVKLKIDAKKKEVEEAAKKKLEEEKNRLAEEAKKKLEEEAKDKLKDLIKF